jgi:hypothetical protein
VKGRAVAGAMLSQAETWSYLLVQASIYKPQASRHF